MMVLLIAFSRQIWNVLSIVYTISRPLCTCYSGSTGRGLQTIPYWEATLSVEHDFGKRADEVVEMITTLATFSAMICRPGIIDS
jgi:hypothetical protein